MNTETYKTDRTGLKIVEDTKDIASDCQVITFINMGDWPCFIKTGKAVKRYLDQFQEVSFGSDRPEVLEAGMFDIEFDAANPGITKEVYLERATYIKQNVC